MPSPISPFYDRELKAEKAGVFVSPISPFFNRELKTAKAQKKADEARERRKPTGVPRAALGAINDAINQRTTTPRKETFRQPPAPMEGGFASPASTEGGFASPTRMKGSMPFGARDARLEEIASASPKQLQEIYEKMPEEERPVHMIRGTDQSYFDPGSQQEYRTFREGLAGGQSRVAAPMQTGASTAGGGMTAYQSAQIEQKGKEFGFKLNQAVLKAGNDAVKTAFGPMEAMGKAPTEEQKTNVWGEATVKAINAHYPPKKAKEMISQIPIDLMRDKETGEVRWENIYGEPVVTGGGEMEAETGGVEGYESAPLPEVPPIDFDYRGMTNSGLRSRSVNAGKLYSGQKEKDSSRYAMGRGAEALGRGAGAVASSVKGRLRDWLKRGNTQIDYPFNRSMM
jgi:hypothetical protein